MDTIKLSGIKPSNTDAFIGLYTRLSVDAVLSLDLRAAVAGDSTQTVDIAQISKRLSRVLDLCVQDDDIAKNSSICLELTAGRLLDSAMKSWLVKQAEITVNAQFKADFNDASYDLPNADGVSITIRRVADDVETSQILDWRILQMRRFLRLSRRKNYKMRLREMSLKISRKQSAILILL